MKSKKLTKKEWIMFIAFMVGSITGIVYEKTAIADNPMYHPKPLTDNEITILNDTFTKAIIIYPIFTQFAYEKNGFYDYYKGKCDSCTTVPMRPFGVFPIYNTGSNGLQYLSKLGYPYITDITVDKHPEILHDYDVIILLHNEYMTQKEFNAISGHKNVVYLYPNSMYVEVSVDYDKSQMTLVRGHGYPQKNIQNGFDYITSSQFEYDTNCNNVKWIEYPNGIALNCFPEYLITYDRTPLQVIKDYPNKVPKLVPLDSTFHNITGLKFCYNNGTCMEPPNGQWNK